MLLLRRRRLLLKNERTFSCTSKSVCIANAIEYYSSNERRRICLVWMSVQWKQVKNGTRCSKISSVYKRVSENACQRRSILYIRIRIPIKTRHQPALDKHVFFSLDACVCIFITTTWINIFMDETEPQIKKYAWIFLETASNLNRENNLLKKKLIRIRSEQERRKW